MVSVKVENDSEVAPKIIKYEVKISNQAENSIASNERTLSELSSLREKYSKVVFDLQKLKETIALLESERENLNAQSVKNIELLFSSDTEKKALMQQLEILREENRTRLSEFQKEKQADTSEMKILNKKNNELRARIKQIHSSIDQVKSSRHQNSIEENEENIYEVQDILTHKENKSGRFFYVRWKGFGPEEDGWVKESDLSCPAILKSYLKKNK